MKIKKFFVTLILLFFSFVSYGQEYTTPPRLTESASSISKKSRNVIVGSSVLVRNDSLGGYGSGNYFILDGHHIVITAAHVVRNAQYATIQTKEENTIGSIIFRNKEFDYAIILVPVITSRDPASFKPSNLEDMLGKPVAYAGFPNREDLMFFTGTISLIKEDVVNVHSYAWMGASGSVVFDAKRRVVGIVRAIEVGEFIGMPQLIEDIIWVVPVTKIDIDAIKKILSEI